MRDVEEDLVRIRETLRRDIRDRGFTQTEVQEALGWGRNSVSELLNAKKPMRMDQVLRILDAIGVRHADFFGEVFGFDPARPS